MQGELDEFTRRTGKAAEPPIELVTRVMFNPNLDGVWFGGVMEVLNQVTLISIILTGAALTGEREHGTLEHLMVMPLAPFQIMAAKVWANGLVILVAAALSLAIVVQGWLGVPITGSIALFLLGTAPPVLDDVDRHPAGRSSPRWSRSAPWRSPPRSRASAGR